MTIKDRIENTIKSQFKEIMLDPLVCLMLLIKYLEILTVLQKKNI